MTKLFTLVATAVCSILAASTTAVEDKCVLIDFTAETDEFTALNHAIGVFKLDSASLLGQYDPLLMNDVLLREFNYSVLGKDVTIVPALQALNVTGLSNLVPERVNVTSPNSVEIVSHSGGRLFADATLNATVVELGISATAQLTFVLEKPTFVTTVEANICGCAPGVSASICSNMTVADLQAKVKRAGTINSYKSILKEVLMKFEDESVKSFTLDFESVSDFELEFDSSSFVFSRLLRLLPDYSADKINKKGTTYDAYVSTINAYVPMLLNVLIESTLKPWFGGACFSEE